jgi:hypothetical protein
VAWFDFVGANTDDIQELANVALGDVAQAESCVRAHAARALTGRLIGEVCDSAVLLAALAHTEGGDDIARALPDHAVAQHLPIAYHTSTEGPGGSRGAMTAVRNELRRQGWD